MRSYFSGGSVSGVISGKRYIEAKRGSTLFDVLGIGQWNLCRLEGSEPDSITAANGGIEVLGTAVSL
jgi:hypothetical protein